MDNVVRQNRKARNTHRRLVDLVLQLMIERDPRQISMRQIARAANLQQSVIYHYFASKEELLKEAFLAAQQGVHQALLDLPTESDINKLLRQRIEYHLDNGHLVIPMLRYFMAFRADDSISPGAYRHIQEVIDCGCRQGVYASSDPGADAKVIAHAINGFLLEHFPIDPNRKSQIVATVQSFAERSLRKEGR